MTYLVAKLWIYLLVAFLIGGYVGWTSRSSRGA
jgi:hypothetical protein